MACPYSKLLPVPTLVYWSIVQAQPSGPPWHAHRDYIEFHSLMNTELKKQIYLQDCPSTTYKTPLGVCRLNSQPKLWMETFSAVPTSSVNNSCLLLIEAKSPYK